MKSFLHGNLRAKLSELALIQEAYEAMIEGSGAAAKDPLALLAYQLEENGLNEFDHVYIDGFLDFTGQELRVLKALIKCSITIIFMLPDPILCSLKLYGLILRIRLEASICRKTLQKPKELALKVMPNCLSHLTLRPIQKLMPL